MIRRLKGAWPVLGVLLASLALAAAFSALVPAFEAPDEPGHYAYIESLWTTHALPVQGLENPLQPEFSQPPLYYVGQALLAAGLPSTPDTCPPGLTTTCSRTTPGPAT